MTANSSKKSALRSLVPAPLVRWALRRRRSSALASRVPLSTCFGIDRGRPVDRYYIEKFLAAHRSDVRGRVLEVGEGTYTRQYGNQAVTTSDVLHASQGNPEASIVG